VTDASKALDALDRLQREQIAQARPTTPDAQQDDPASAYARALAERRSRWITIDTKEK
jgi:hypothetical protein